MIVSVILVRVEGGKYNKGIINDENAKKRDFHRPGPGGKPVAGTEIYQYRCLRFFNILIRI